MDRRTFPSPTICCTRTGRAGPSALLVLTALLALILSVGLTAPRVYAQEPLPPTDRRADLGDAPDSTNHHGIDNTAYPGVPGRFPTVFDGTPAGEGRGPLHHNTDQVWLGDRITQEAEADIGPDQDKDGSGADLNNILDDGKDNANNDGGDDGWLNREKTRFPDCQETELIVRVRKNPATQQTRAFLNVWFDGNRDGDWADQGRCEPDGHSNEWIVQNFPIDLTAFSGDFADIPVKTVLVYNAKPEQPAWVRFMLSDEPAIAPPQTATTPNPLPDGRGPDNGYNIGETEDYLVRFTDVPPTDLRTDLGDAPDGTNHHGLPQNAYPGTPARFPTVWDVASPDVSGPKHADATIVWLGERVTVEDEADRPPDMDPTTNITANGSDVNAMDQDRADDGWLNRTTARFLDCRQEKLHVRISDRPGVNARVYLNVYFDGDRNGRWGERKECGPSPTGGVNYGHEWIVQNFPIDTSTFTGTVEMWIPTMLVRNDHPDADAWVRFMLSESPVTELAPFEHDGRGPQAPGMWQMGETEDYLWQPPIPPQDERKPDLGDAPDSTNHHGLKQEAYPGVAAEFPTVWDVASPDVSGPKHENALPIRLGYHVSGEAEADKLPDEDGVTNITDNGADPASMDKDEGDDGWLRIKETRFVNCEETRLLVRVSNLGLSTTPNGRRMFLNVWFDGNRNGRWGERRPCTDQPVDDKPDDFAHEWIVQNFVIVVPGTPAVQDIVVPTYKVLNEKPNAAAWVRFTLSEEPIKALAPFQHDGRGPQAPAMWKLGETEDYLYVPPFDQGEPGKVRAVKTSSADGHTVTLGDVFTYTVQIEHVGGSVPIHLNMVDPLPAEVTPVGPPTVQELNPVVNTLLIQYTPPPAGPSGTVLWKGSLSPNAKVAIHIPVKVTKCPPQDNPEIVNKALVLEADGTEVAKLEHRLKAECKITPPDVILEKRAFHNNEVVQPQEPGGAQQTDVEVLRSQEFGYDLVLHTRNLPAAQTFVITDTPPFGLEIVGVKTEAGEAVVREDDNGRQTLFWKLRLSPDHPTARLRMVVKPTERILCGDRLINIAHWSAVVDDEVVARGQSNPVVIVLTCADLGDAPDSTNHAGVRMHAYPGVEARFPTVFDPATGPDQGPKHMVTWPMHLGRGVSEEFEADLGPDADPTNNILPKLDKPNKDERDDGIVWEKLRFEDCRVATIPVIVAIDPRVPAMLPDNEEAIGYLNVWLDSNRDGAWDDAYKCPGAEGQTIPGWEHIVVDHKLDIRALGPGVHIIPVTTNWPVSWPKEFEDKPAWLRVTLSERPSNKVLDCGVGTCHIGDGRGYPDPFRFGETEDYLYRQGREGEPPTEGMDPAVRKKGHLQRFRLPEEGVQGWLATWVVEYRNKGSVAATHVVITDTLSGPQTLRRQQAIPPVPHTANGNDHIYTVGNLAPGAGGVIILETTLPLDTAPGTVITNTVTISADHDDDPSNNTDVVTLTVPLLPPVITYPTPSTTCTGTFTVTGRVQPGAMVDLTITDASGTAVVSTTVTPDSNGHWAYPVSGLADGKYEIAAVAKLGSQTSPATTVVVIVDSTFFWDPSSLRFQDEDGHVVLPRDSSGRMDGSGWRVFLRRGTTYTVTVKVCCGDPNAQVTLELGDFATLTLTDPDGDRIYSATFTTPSTGPIQGALRICVVCNLIKVCSDGEITIDPEGTVFDILTGQAINAAQVACLVQEVSGAGGEPTYTLWPAADFDQVNPQTTGSDGYFSFFTPPGTYQLQVEKEGYQAYRSPDLVVVDKPVHYDVPLTPAVADEAGAQVLITENGFEPSVLTVAPGTVVEFVNATGTLRGAKSITPTAEYQGPARLQPTDAFDSGLLAGGESYKRKLTTEGTYTYVDPSNPSFSGSIIVQQPAAVEQKIFLPTVSR